MYWYYDTNRIPNIVTLYLILKRYKTMLIKVHDVGPYFSEQVKWGYLSGKEGSGVYPI